MVKDTDSAAEVLQEPTQDQDETQNNIWMRGLFMIIFALLFGAGEMVLGIAALVQFFWMLIKKERNAHIVDFGEDLSDWLARVARFQTGASEDKPFPFTKWGRA